MDPGERRCKQLARNVIERVERDDGVERRGIELQAGEVRLDERCIRHRGAGAAHLLGRDVDAGHLEACGEALRIWNTRTAAELEHAGAVLQPRHQLVLPLAARIPQNPVAPVGEAFAHRVVAATDELCARIAHPTPTRSHVRASKRRS